MNCMKRIATFFIFLSITTLSAQAGTLERLFFQERQQTSQALHSPVQSGWFSQRLDANDPYTPMFKQRYYVNEEFVEQSSTAPVFFYICGEAACEPGVLNGAIREYARKFHARLVALEHRYYGKSQPFPNLSRQNLRYLTTEAALNDLAFFQGWMQHKKSWNGKWVAFGGSYPGSLAAYYRMKYPYLVEGALASSAPVRAKEAFIDYDAHVTKVAGEACAEAMREVVHTVESQLADAQARTAVKKRFGAVDVIDDTDFLYLIADIGASAVQYGLRDSLCRALTQSEDRVKAYAEFAHEIYLHFGVSAVDLTPQAAVSESIDEAKQIGMRQWLYQSCTEYGYWQTAHPSAALSTRSARINLDYSRQVCKRLFDLDTPADTTRINTDYFAPLLSSLTGRIFFINGSNDPWSTLSLTPQNSDENPNLQTMLLKGAAHCDDLRVPRETDSQDIIKARRRMVALLEQWLN